MIPSVVNFDNFKDPVTGPAAPCWGRGFCAGLGISGPSDPGTVAVDRVRSAASPLMQEMIDACMVTHTGGSCSPRGMVTLNDASTVEVAVKGEPIFELMAREVEKAEQEVLLQTFAWERDTRAVSYLSAALKSVAARKAQQREAGQLVSPLRVHVLVDERGAVAHRLFTGKCRNKWDTTAETLGLYACPGLVEVYVDTFHHNTLAGTHAKTLVVDGRSLVITGANVQQSNFGHIPAHDAALALKGPVAQGAREDFSTVWDQRSKCDPEADLGAPPNYEFPAEVRPIPVLFATRNARAVRNYTHFDNPQNCALQAALAGARSSIQMATPNLNTPFVIRELANFINERQGTVELLLGKGFNDFRESWWGLGGTNQAAVDSLYRYVRADKWERLKVRWFSLDGKQAVQGNVAGAAHLKFCAVDGQVSCLGNANMDQVSSLHLHEANVWMDDAEKTQLLTNSVFSKEFAQAIPALPSESYKEMVLEAVGCRGYQESLASKHDVVIESARDEKQGFRAIQLTRPENFEFQPGQYVELRSGSALGGCLRKKAVVAISSGIEDETIDVVARPSRLPWHANHCLGRGEGEALELLGPLGTPFPMDMVRPEAPLWIVGAGSGMTALRSVLRSLPSQIKPQVYFSAKVEDDLLFQDEVSIWRASGHVISLTQEENPRFAEGRVTDQLREVEVPANSLVFICGPTSMVQDTARLFESKGVPAQQIFASLPTRAKEGGPIYRGDHPRIGL